MNLGFGTVKASGGVAVLLAWAVFGWLTGQATRVEMIALTAGVLIARAGAYLIQELFGGLDVRVNKVVLQSEDGQSLELLMRLVPVWRRWIWKMRLHRPMNELQDQELLLLSGRLASAFCDYAVGWIDVLDEDGNPEPFDRDKLKKIVREDARLRTGAVAKVADVAHR